VYTIARFSPCKLAHFAYELHEIVGTYLAGKNYSQAIDRIRFLPAVKAEVLTPDYLRVYWIVCSSLLKGEGMGVNNCFVTPQRDLDIGSLQFLETYEEPWM